jgi:hypothetical protein
MEKTKEHNIAICGEPDYFVKYYETTLFNGSKLILEDTKVSEIKAIVSALKIL